MCVGHSCSKKELFQTQREIFSHICATSALNVFLQKRLKTPTKMDVAPWDKHWIMRELDGFGFYSMVFVEIQ